ncbi:hypothetical protein NST83_01100 [Paenibacillus sp. FSL R10-2782]|uniref:hypothetical protein n=1 Tax=Paenibacillus sp. FSL R10-2782 TaxID=2954661 RepID=UPI003157FAD2
MYSFLIERNGISYDPFMSRVNRGWSMEKAATKPLPTAEERRQQSQHATNHLRVYPVEYIQLANQNGIPYHTFFNRAKNCGWDMDRAATEPLWTREQMGRLGAQRLREREGDWAAQIFGKQQMSRKG